MAMMFIGNGLGENMVLFDENDSDGFDGSSWNQGTEFWARLYLYMHDEFILKRGFGL